MQKKTFSRNAGRLDASLEKHLIDEEIIAGFL